MATPKKKVKIIESYCHRCGQMCDIEEFYQSLSPYNTDMVLPYCKTCCDDIAEQYFKKTKSLEATVYFLCSMNDVPFLKTIYESMEKYIETKNVKNIKPFRLYMNQFGIAKEKKGFRSKCFSDSDVALGDIKKLRKNEEALKLELESLELDWGKQEELDDYSFLELKFETYAEGRKLTPSMEQTIRYLCLAELDVRKLRDKEMDTSNAEKRVAGYYKSLKMDDFSDDSNKSNDQKFIEARIAKIEQTKPAEEYNDKKLYADFQGFEKYGEDHLLRPLKNLLLGQREYHIKGDDD